jgi:hypothetical protein
MGEFGRWENISANRILSSKYHIPAYIVKECTYSSSE